MDVPVSVSDWNAIKDGMGRQQAEIERLRKALRKYGDHTEGCSSWDGYEIAEPCNCGYREALEEK